MSDVYSDMRRVLTSSRPSAGHFSVVRRIEKEVMHASEWHNCREIWHEYCRNHKLFLFSHTQGKGRVLAHLLRRVESRVGANGSLVGPTQRKTISWVESSSWWRRSSMRISFLTLVFRVAPAYKPDKDNFEDAIFSSPLTADTRYAVNRFLQGYTRYTGKVRGWWAQFADLDQAEVNDLLVEP